MNFTCLRNPICAAVARHRLFINQSGFLLGPRILIIGKVYYLEPRGSAGRVCCPDIELISELQ